MTETSRPQALVVGGARRVGRAICIALAKGGCDVVTTYRGSAQDVMETIGLMEEHGGTHRAVPLELENLQQLALEAEALARTNKRWDVLVFSASTYEAAAFKDLSVEQLQRDVNVNALAPAIIAQRFAPYMRSSVLAAGAAIIAMLDIHALGRPRKNYVSYAMSKAALGEMVQSLARELAPEIRVNAVAPGVVAWPIDQKSEDAEIYLKRVPLSRAGTPQEAAEVVRWLALDASYVTGEIIRVDGGRWLN